MKSRKALYERLESALGRDNRSDAGYDELARPEQKRFASWVERKFGPGGMARAQELVASEFALPRPVSLVPRILPPELGDKVLRGVEQRVRLFRAIHEDWVNGSWIQKQFPEFDAMLRSYRKYRPPGGIRLPDGSAPLSTILGCDLILAEDGSIATNEDNVGSDVLGPSDLFHLRRAFQRALPDALSEFGVEPNLHYPEKLRELAKAEMARLGIQGLICWVRSNLSIESIRANQDSFFERELAAFEVFAQAALVRHVTLAEIEVHGGRARLKTGEDIGYLWFNGHPAWIAAVPGLTDVIGAGQVGYNAYANAEYLGDQTLQCFLPELAAHFLGTEPLLIEPLPTFAICPGFDGRVDERVLSAWRDHPERLVLKERSGQGGKSVLVGRFITGAVHAQSLEKIQANPSEFLIQAYHPISRFGERRIDLRMICHIGLTEATSWVVPSGVSRSSASTQGKTNLSLGGQEHDTWFMKAARPRT